MSIMKTPFGRLPGGEGAFLYTMTNARGESVSITNYGGIVTAVRVLDRAGQLADVVLGCDTVEKYVPNNGYLGALIGRVGNRINRGRCVLNGQALQLAANSNGHHLHGGDVGFDKKLWAVEEKCAQGLDQLILTAFSPDGEEHYPGNLQVKVTYGWSDEGELSIHYQARSDKDTLCSLTNHSYFNLRGEGSGLISDQMIEINADRFTVVDKDCIPSGELRPVEGTPFDLRTPKCIQDGLDQVETDEQMGFGGGYDHNFALNGSGMRRAAMVFDPESGRKMQVYTDMPGVQFYAGNMLDGTMQGKCGHAYQPREGLCLETQFYPDSINHPNFPDSVLRAGQEYDFTTVYAFSAE
jgi:aldose 1-epimerase